MTQLFIAREIETGSILADRVTLASRRVERAVGLLGRTHLDTGEALWITPCHGVHTWFMRFTIDVIAMDAEGVIVDSVSMLKPWRMRLPRPGAHSVLELPAGTLLTAPVKVGHRIQIAGWNPAIMPARSDGGSAAKSA
jgi:uncharacterized membrane protein (UPF0127 family)